MLDHRSLYRLPWSLSDNPIAWLEPLHFQAVLVIQPIDVLEDGRANMCDGCPDMTVWDGKLAWSCRLEEQRCFNSWLTAVPKTTRKTAATAAS